MLAKVLAAGEEEAGVEVADVTDDVTRTKKALAQRTPGDMGALSGAHGLTYMEVWPLFILGLLQDMNVKAERERFCSAEDSFVCAWASQVPWQE